MASGLNCTAQLLQLIGELRNIDLVLPTCRCLLLELLLRLDRPPLCLRSLGFQSSHRSLLGYSLRFESLRQRPFLLCKVNILSGYCRVNLRLEFLIALQRPKLVDQEVVRDEPAGCLLCRSL